MKLAVKAEIFASLNSTKWIAPKGLFHILLR